MSDMAVIVITIIITTCLMMHFLVIAAQTTVLVVESVATGALMRRFFYPALLQNAGVAIALIGFTFRLSELPIIGALLVCTGVICATGRPHALYRHIELPLLLSALASFTAVGMVRGFF